MAVPKLFNMAQMTTYTTGVGAVTLVANTPGYNTFISAGVNNGDTVRYAIYEANKREYGYGVVTIAGTTITMTRVFQGSTTGAILDLQGSAIVSLTPAAEDFINPVATILNFGATVGGIVDASAAIIDMATAVGYVVIPAGNFRIATNTTVNVLVFFDTGAYITIDPLVTVTFASRIESARQYIFRGSGTVAFTGDDSRQAHVSWFGAFPAVAADQAPALQLCALSMDNTRESIIDVDVGAYRIDTPVAWQRATLLRGAGTRRTVFQLANFVGADVFTTAGEGCTFRGFQFENGGASWPSGAAIHALHAYTMVEDAGFYNVLCGARFSAQGCRAKQITSLVGSPATAGTSIIDIQAPGCIVSDVYQIGATGPESIVSVGSASISVTTFTVEDIRFTTPSIGVLVQSRNAYIAKGVINNIEAEGAGASAVKLINAAGNTLQDITINNISVASSMTNGVSIDVSAGNINNLIIDNVNCVSPSGAGISLVRSGGVLSDVRIGLCRLDGAATPIFRSGTMTNISVDYQTQIPRGNPTLSWTAYIPTNGVYIVDLGTNIFSSALFMSVGITYYGQYIARAATTPGMVALHESASVAHTTGPLTGTTGSVGNITVSVDANGLYYVENRVATQQTVELTIATGIVP